MNASFPADPIKPSEAAKLLAVDRASIYRYLRAGKLSCWVLPGGGLRLSRAEVLGAPVPMVASTEAAEAARRLAALRARTAEGMRRFGLT